MNMNKEIERQSWLPIFKAFSDLVRLRYEFRDFEDEDKILRALEEKDLDDLNVNLTWDTLFDNAFAEETLAHSAASLHSFKLMKKLLEFKHIEINQSNRMGDTPFMLVCFRASYDQRYDVLELLLADKRLEFNLFNRKGESFVFWTLFGLYPLKVIQCVIQSRHVISPKTIDRQFLPLGYPGTTNGKPRDSVKLLINYQNDWDFTYPTNAAGLILLPLLLVSEGYFTILFSSKERLKQRAYMHKRHRDLIRFLGLTPRLPLELQMVICNRGAGNSEILISSGLILRSLKFYLSKGWLS